MATSGCDSHLNDVGTIFELTVMDCNVLLDISAATKMDLVFKKPDNSTITVAMSFVTDGTDSLLKYTTVLNDLDQVGDWQGQLDITFPSGKWHSSTFDFRVVANL